MGQQLQWAASEDAACCAECPGCIEREPGRTLMSEQPLAEIRNDVGRD